MVISTLALLSLVYSFLMQWLVSRAAAPEGQCPIECRGYFVHPYVRLLGPGLRALASVSGPWPQPPGPGFCLWAGRTDGRMYVLGRLLGAKEWLDPCTSKWLSE